MTVVAFTPETIEAWFEDELARYDPSYDEAHQMQVEFALRERGKWTIHTWSKHMEKRIIEMRTGFTL